MAFTPSPQQSAVLDWTVQGTGSAIVVAVAGAGKTTTLVELLARTRGNVAFLAYNKKIAEEIQARVEPLGLGNRVRCGTFHSFGFGALRRAFPRVRLDQRRRDDDVLAHLGLVGQDHKATANVVLKAMSLAKQRGLGLLVHYTDHKAWLDMADHFGLDEDLAEDANGADLETVLRLAAQGLQFSQDNVGAINFDDMIWLPLVKKLRPWQNDWVLVDEAQDTNPARRALARMLLKPAGRAVFVGDPCQAIYGFTGADSDSLEQIARDFNACELPLTITYRCPKAVVAVAQTWVQHIEAAATAPQGVVRQLANMVEG